MDLDKKYAEYDSSKHRRYCGRQIVERELSILEGILHGIAIDSKLTDGEVAALKNWADSCAYLFRKEPFTQLGKTISGSMADGIITAEEREDILWLCSRVRFQGGYYNLVTHSMQTLHGLLEGIASDRKIEVGELRGVEGWLDDHRDLKGSWPYDEVDSVLCQVLADGKIDAREHRFLLVACSDFAAPAAAIVHDPSFGKDMMRTGICAVCPDVVFKRRLFCFTGASSRCTRSELADIVTQLGGMVADSVRHNLNYLVVGNEGSECWAFSCYGRKIEAAVALRKEGRKVQIVQENDFWDAAADAGYKEKGHP